MSIESKLTFKTHAAMEADSLAKGERLVAWLRILMSGIAVIILLGYVSRTTPINFPSLFAMGAIAISWGLLSSFYLIFCRRIRHQLWMSYLSIMVDLATITAACTANIMIMPFNYVSGVTATMYFMIIALAALRKNRVLIFVCGIGSAITHLIVTSIATYSYLPGGFAIVSIAGETMFVSYLDEITRAFLMVTVAAAFSYVTKELQDSERHYHDLFEHVPDGILISTTSGEIIAVNRQFCSIIQRPSSSIVGMRLDQVFDTPAAQSAELAGQKQKSEEGTGILKRSDGASIPVRTVAVPAEYKNLPCIEMSVRDVTKQIELERQLAQSQKMETLGRLAGGLAHDFNNILGGTLGATSLAERNIRRVEDPTLRLKLEKQLSVVRSCTVRARDVVSKLMTLSRNKSIEREPVDLASIISDVAMICRNTLGVGIQLEVKLDREVAVAEGDSTSLTQTFLNLCINAKDAMPNGGILEIHLSEVSATDPRILAHVENPLALVPMWQVAVRDTGVGISPEIIGKIFDPFFTTKPVGEGTGLGLAMVYNIAIDHGGFVDVESLESGTAFNFYMPQARPSLLPPDTDDITLPRGSGRILIVDDEEIVRSSIGGMLRELGYEVVTASSGEEALHIFDSSKSPFCLAIVDIVMPRMDGTQVLAKLRERDTDFAIIMASGYWAEEEASSLATKNISGFLKKPFSMEDLAYTVARALTTNHRKKLTQTPG